MDKKSEIHLLEFTVENYRSIREPVTLSLLSTKYHDRTADFKLATQARRALSSVALYGANASGKSNVLRAFFFFWHALEGHRAISYEKNIPFLLDDSSRTRDSVFEAVFEFKGKLFIYGFRYSSGSQVVTREWLRASVGSRKYLSKIYERTNDVIDINKNIPLSGHGISRTYAKQLKSDELFIATLSKSPTWTIAKDVVNSWANCHISNTLVHDPIEQVATMIFEKPETKELLLPLLQEADFNISDVKVSKREDSDRFDIKLGHLYATKNSVKTVWFDIHDQESAGTKKFFSFALPLLLSLRDGSLIVLDELGSTLHPDLLRFVVDLFNNPNKNPNHAQLVLTTHDTSLLKESFARDQIYFTQKDAQQSTHLYSLTDIKGVRKDLANLDERYLRGDFGATPNIID